MAGRLPVVRYRELLRALAKDDWYIDHTSRHVVIRHPDRPGSIPVPNHPRDEVPRGTLRSILNAAGVSPERLRELL
jgi:predicted RNA binding protein YcfA (HicA-like mRNA interferase family)